MTKAIILSAGQGRRLLPLTENQPKCLLKIAGKSVLEWQLEALVDAGISEVSIITGFHSMDVERLVDRQFGAHKDIRCIYNPFFNVSDNLASCWLAREEMNDDFLLINGDTVFEQSLLQHVLASTPGPITLTIDTKQSYDEDDMKVTLDGEWVRNVSKILTEEQTHAESIGLLYFRGEGPQLFCNAVVSAMRTPAGLKSWFLSVIDSLAKEKQVRACSIKGHGWQEIDFLPDLENAEKLLGQR